MILLRFSTTPFLLRKLAWITQSLLHKGSPVFPLSPAAWNRSNSYKIEHGSLNPSRKYNGCLVSFYIFRIGNVVCNASTNDHSNPVGVTADYYAFLTLKRLECCGISCVWLLPWHKHSAQNEMNYLVGSFRDPRNIEHFLWHSTKRKTNSAALKRGWRRERKGKRWKGQWWIKIK